MDRRDALKETVLLFGYTISIPSLLSMLAGCGNDTKLAWQPQLFSAAQATTISELSETILPRTNTPGARDLHIDEFIDKILKQVLSEEDQKRFLRGIDAFEDKAREVNGKNFAESSPAERSALLTALEKESAKSPLSIWGIGMKKDSGPLPFYRQVKDLVLLGYFTSKALGKEVLQYDPVPGKFVADMPLVQPGYISFE